MMIMRNVSYNLAVQVYARLSSIQQRFLALPAAQTLSAVVTAHNINRPETSMGIGATSVVFLYCQSTNTG